MATLYVMVGPPACGKSAYIKDNIKEGQKWISRDAIRFAVMKQKNTNDYFKYEKYVFQQFVKQIDDGFDVYADATHTNAVSRQKLLRAITAQPDEIIYVVIGFSKEYCISNNKNRQGIEQVPNKVIYTMCDKFEMPQLKTEGGDKIIYFYAKGSVSESFPFDYTFFATRETEELIEHLFDI